MNNNEPISAAEQLKQHFAARVLHQARQVIDLWQTLTHSDWSTELHERFSLNVEKLLRSAQRFNAEQHKLIAIDLLNTFTLVRPGDVPNSEQLKQLHSIILKLSRTSLRHSDSHSEKLPAISRKPVYVAVESIDSSAVLVRQMQYFRLYPETAHHPAELQALLRLRHPAVLVIDIDFGGPAQGIHLVKELQENRETNLPVVFTYRQEHPNLEQQLNLMRIGSVCIFQETDVHGVISTLERLLDNTPEPAFKVLVVDDSRAQSLFTSNALNKAGMLTEIVNDPLQVFTALNSFAPDLVLMDMYMPNCTGVELARVIRQQQRYLNLPIIYLSGEEDRERQLAAMAEAGDDFLTKPVEPRHLLSTVSNRIRRARQLHTLIARDSLTGLLNHTHILGELQHAMNQHTDVCFIMVDIDHFKQVNDTYGHPVGDDVIRNLALFLRQHLRSTDPIGRYGGEEFAVILTDVSEEQAVRIMNNIRTSFAQLLHNQDNLTVTFSCGVAQWQSESLSELVALADQALYYSKHNGRNQVTGASTIKT